MFCTDELQYRETVLPADEALLFSICIGNSNNDNGP